MQEARKNVYRGIAMNEEKIGKQLTEEDLKKYLIFMTML